MEKPKSHLGLSFLTLFTSTGTLICCALPALMVSLGMGAALAGLVTHVPQLIWLSERKLAVFGMSGLMLLAAGILVYRARNAPCPIDPELRRACTLGRKYSFYVYIVALITYLIGAFFSFAAPYLF